MWDADSCRCELLWRLRVSHCDGGAACVGELATEGAAFFDCCGDRRGVANLPTESEQVQTDRVHRISLL